MFRSATLRLTGWYLLVLMGVSLLFSGLILSVSSHEVNERLQHFQTSLIRPIPPPNQELQPNDLRMRESRGAFTDLGLTLLYINLGVLVGGGLVCYLLARRTLRPIEEAHEAQQRFASDASHELRTPLAAMRAETEAVLMDGEASVDDLRQALQGNLEEIGRLTNLSETLLNLAKLDHEALELAPHDLYELSQTAAAHFATKRIIIQRRHVHVLANEPAFTEMLSVLIDNALKYSPKGSPVRIRLQGGKVASFSITNAGPGITSEQLPHVFERFYRADSSRTASGFGLGLSLAQRIVKLHKGTITVTSTPGKTTTFRITLPSAVSA